MRKLTKQFLRTTIAKGCSNFRKLGMKRKRKANVKHTTFHTTCLPQHVTVTNRQLGKMKIIGRVQVESKSKIKTVTTVSLDFQAVSRITKDYSPSVVLERKSIICPKDCLPGNQSLSNYFNKDSTSVKNKEDFQRKERNDLVQMTSYDHTFVDEQQQEIPRTKLDMSDMQSVKTKHTPRVDSAEENNEVCDSKFLKPCETQNTKDILTENGFQKELNNTNCQSKTQFCIAGSDSQQDGIRKGIEKRKHVPSVVYMYLIYCLGVLLPIIKCAEERLKSLQYFDTLRSFFDTLRSLLVLKDFLSLALMEEKKTSQCNAKVLIHFLKTLTKNYKIKEHQILVKNGIFDTYQSHKIWRKQLPNVISFPTIIELNHTSYERIRTFSAYYGKTRLRDTTFQIMSEHGLYYSGRGVNLLDRNVAPQILQVTCEECKRKVSVYEDECYESARFHDITCEFYGESLETDCSEEDASTPEVFCRSPINALTTEQRVLGAEGGQAFHFTDEHETEGKQSDKLTPEPGTDGSQLGVLLSRPDGGQPCQSIPVSGVERELSVQIPLLGAEEGHKGIRLFEKLLLGKRLSFTSQHNGILEFIHFCLPAVFGTICQRCVEEKHVHEQLKRSGLNSSEFIMVVGTHFLEGRYGEALWKIANKFDIPLIDNVIDFCPRSNDKQKYISEETVITEIFKDVRIKSRSGSYIPYLESFHVFLQEYMNGGRLNVSAQTLVSDWLKSEGSQGFEKRLPPLLILPMYRYTEDRTSIVPLFSTSKDIDQQITISTNCTYRLLALSSWKQRHLTCYFPWENDIVYYNNEHSEKVSQVVLCNETCRFIDQKGILPSTVYVGWLISVLRQINS